MKSPTPSFVCASCARALRSQASQPTRRAFSATTSQESAEGRPNSDNPIDIPRWKQTPSAMRMPIRLRPKPKQPVWEVNTEQEPVDDAFDRFLGRIGGNTPGREMLDDETKWLSLTHKSHSHGTQGFNDRLAFLGKRIVDLQTSLALVRTPVAAYLLPARSETEIYEHPSLAGLENISTQTKYQLLSRDRLARLANTYRLDRVVRWKPRKAENLQSSGVETVLAHTMYSIIGALALKRGGEVAARTARERILAPLGLK